MGCLGEDLGEDVVWWCRDGGLRRRREWDKGVEGEKRVEG